MAWNETVDNTERGTFHFFYASNNSSSHSQTRIYCELEASIHQAFIESLDTHIIEPLNKHKVRSMFWKFCM